MADKLFSLLRNERARLERAISDADAIGEASQRELRLLKALHRAVDEQIHSWMRDLSGDGNERLKKAAIVSEWAGSGLLPACSLKRFA